MIIQNLDALRTISSSSLAGVAQNTDYNFNQLKAGLLDFLDTINYNDSSFKLGLTALDVTGDVQFYNKLGFGSDPLAPTLLIQSDGSLVAQNLAAPVINVTRLRFTDFNTVSNIGAPGIFGEVVYVAPGVYPEGIYAYLVGTGWTALTGGSGGGGGGATALSGLTDVSFTSIHDGDFLAFNTSTNKWENTHFTINVNDFFAGLNTVLTAPFIPYWDGTVLKNSLIRNDAPNSIVSINGDLTANSKSFLIPHPSKKNYMLRYGSLEGPEHAVYFRGRSETGKIKLPKYWKDLIDENTITVNLTPIGSWHELYVESVSANQIIVGGAKKKSYFFTVFGERKDIAKLTVEFKNTQPK